MRGRIGCLLGIVCAWCVSCGEASAPTDATVPAQDEIEELRALGYLDFSPKPADPSERGARVLDRGRTMPGYRLYTSNMRCRATLIDLDGEVVHAWSHPCKRWMHSELLPDGHLLVSGTDPSTSAGETDRPAERRFVLRLDWDGDVVWRARIPAHHDVEQVPGGQVLALTRRVRSDHPFEAGTVLVDHGFETLSADGERLDSISLYDLVVENEIGFELEPVAPRGRTRRLDVLHSNSIEAMRRPELADRHPLYSLDNVLISLRHQDSIFIVDRRARKLVWAWGRGELSGPHDARVLDGGNFLIFDNGLARGRSRVVEVDPLRGEVVWSYDGGDEPFFTKQRGSSQRLPNGNHLVAVSNDGEAFEVAPDGEIVWRFWNPDIHENGHREVIVRMVWVPAETVEPLLDGPGQPKAAQR
ncbi:MAG: aryl-sulfate sulfotransferase [Proteobacteria bacterium]|nr:aryl-sulfate sulfotransferase [Pseudomonadota bacterium]